MIRNTTALTLIAVASALAGCGERDEPDLEPAPEVEAPTTTTTERPADGSPDGDGPPPGKPGGPAESADGDPRVTALEAAAGRTVKQFVSALDERAGARACALLAPGALAEVELPKPGGGCAASLAASIGYRDPRGFPVWKSAEVNDLRSVEIDGETGRVVATVVTQFADRREASVEDDIVYLVRDGDGWLIAKPSSTVYRAVGIADVPPSVLAPPQR